MRSAWPGERLITQSHQGNEPIFFRRRDRAKSGDHLPPQVSIYRNVHVICADIINYSIKLIIVN